MHTRRTFHVAVATIGLAVALSPAAVAQATSVKAHAADDGDATALIYPSLMNTRLLRAQSSLDRAARYADLAEPAKAVVALTAARSNLSKAWSGAKYVIATAPPPAPPVTDAASFHLRAFLRSGRLRIFNPDRHGLARKADAIPPIGAAPATIYDTALAVLSLQHYTVNTTVGLIDDSSGPTLSAVRSTLARSLNDRDAAISYIHSVDPGPPPPDSEDPSWSAVMPTAAPQLDDEIQQVEGTLAETGLTGAQTSILEGARSRTIKTQAKITQFWPPLPATD